MLVSRAGGFLLGRAQQGQEARRTTSGPLEQPGMVIWHSGGFKVEETFVGTWGNPDVSEHSCLPLVSAFVFATYMRPEQCLYLRKTRRSFVSKQPWLQVWELVTFLLLLGFIPSLVLTYESPRWSWGCHRAMDWWRQRGQFCLVFIFLMKQNIASKWGQLGCWWIFPLRWVGSQDEPPGPPESLTGNPCAPFQDGCQQTHLACLCRHK